MEHSLNQHFETANDAFEFYLNALLKYGHNYRDTLTLFNVGFYINNPLNYVIKYEKRKWSLDYAKKEFDWYLSANTNAHQIATHASIWYNHMDIFGDVNSNYGYQWSQKNQLQNIIDKIKKDKETRQAWITIYDGKQIKNSSATLNGYETDTPCTLNIGFNVINNKLCMTVYMRSI